MSARSLAWISLIAAIGCGEEGTSARVLVPWQLELACNPGALDAMEAVLYVDNTAVCPLSVSPVDYSVSGACSGIPPALVRPLILEYRLPHPSGPVPLAYLFSSVDLRVPATDRIGVDLTDAALVYTQSDLEAIVIPGDICPPVDATGPAWGRCFVQQTLNRTLDCAMSGEANLVRACEQRLACP